MAKRDDRKSELADAVSDPTVRARTVACRRTAIEPGALGRAIRP
jgi:hypothetical protein